MVFLVWFLQVLVFFAVLKVAQIVFWNVRRAVYIHPWVVELIVAVLIVLLLATASGWALVVGLGLLIGVVRGDMEEDTKPSRELM